MNFEYLVNRLMTDDTFRNLFIYGSDTDRRDALKSIKITPTDGMMQALAAVDYKKVEAAATQVGTVKPMN